MSNNFKIFDRMRYLLCDKATDEDLTYCGDETGEIRKNMKNIDDVHIFEIEESIKELFLITDCPKDSMDIKLPFNNIFIDTSFILANLNLKTRDALEEINGIMLTQREGEKDGYTFTMIEAVYLIKEIDTYTFGFETLDVKAKGAKVILEDEHGMDGMISKQLQKFIHDFCLKFLNFVNNPDIDIETDFRSERNKQLKRKRGQPVFSSLSKIILKGRLKEQVEKLRGFGNEITCKFWVRGHFHKYHKQGGIVVKWILPYIKGKGMLVKKSYKLKNTEKK